MDRLKNYDSKIMAGFGIRTPAQVRTLEPYCDASIAGSYIVGKITEAWEKNESGEACYKAAADAVRYLLE